MIDVTDDKSISPPDNASTRTELSKCCPPLTVVTLLKSSLLPGPSALNNMDCEFPVVACVIETTAGNVIIPPSDAIK